MLPDAAPIAAQNTTTLVSDALLQAIDTVDASHFRNVIKHLCSTNSALVQGLRNQLLIAGKDVVRYHADTDSEDAGFSDVGSDENNEDYEARHEKVEAAKNLRAINLGDAELTRRFLKCENCKEDFDIGQNERGDCLWHTRTLFLLSLDVYSFYSSRLANACFQKRKKWTRTTRPGGTGRSGGKVGTRKMR
jgi:hypothetical protein